jgi:excisionase family DNA binding protein
MTPDMVAERWGVSANTVRALIAERKLRAFRVGRLYRVPLDAVLEYEAREDSPCQNTGSESSTTVSSSRGGTEESDTVIVLTPTPLAQRSAKPSTK